MPVQALPVVVLPLVEVEQAPPASLPQLLLRKAGSGVVESPWLKFLLVR